MTAWRQLLGWRQIALPKQTAAAYPAPRRFANTHWTQPSEQARIFLQWEVEALNTGRRVGMGLTRRLRQHGRPREAQVGEQRHEGLQALPAVGVEVEGVVVEKALAGLEADAALRHVALHD